VDLVVTNAEVVNDLSKSGDVAASGKTLLMISKIGLAVKAGAPKPDISTADKLKAALLGAKTIGYSQGTSGQHFLTVIERLGIADAVKAKAVIVQGEPVGAVIAKGAAEIGVQQVAELLPVPGIDFVGVLPGDLQKQIPYSAGIPAKAKDGATARALIDFLRSEPVLAVLKQKAWTCHNLRMSIVRRSACFSEFLEDEPRDLEHSRATDSLRRPKPAEATLGFSSTRKTIDNSPGWR
jgi:molybdate transport system substrate-binding protein